MSSSEGLRRLFAELGFVTGSETLLPVLRQAYKAASASDVTILLEGETGTGKQVLARAIHQLDQKRRAFPFVTVHCSTITEALAESELFGHHRGAFTGATADRAGLFSAANHGTLFLDDVNDLPLTVQPKLLDVIQRNVVRAVGSDREAPLDIRIIAASNQPLLPLVLRARFRPDLYHRLNVIRLSLPPLRQRALDLPELVLALARRYRSLYHPIEQVDSELVRFLECHSFAGNVRELENAVQRMLFSKSQGTTLDLADWLAQGGEEEPENNRDWLGEAAQNLWEAIRRRGLSYAQALRQIDRRILETALGSGVATRREVARQLQTSERTLYHKIRLHHLGQRNLRGVKPGSGAERA
ncbi:MAG TPA: sigma 54-interacting transcriptional regulator [Candidatus Acidoferrales bacterium]|nr:sigma 54-interacting transcriptional regulator [Candidatus Acidoferrales bacterium]